MSSKFTNSQPTIEVKVNSPTANVGIADTEYNIRLNPDVEANIFATKTELSAVENKIPAEYVKSAAVADNKLTLTKQDNTVVEFEGGSSYTLPVASTTTLGGVKVDGTSITIADGVISTDLPTKTSDLTNDSGFITNEYHDITKQDKLVAGDNITIEDNVISSTGGSSYTLPVASTTTLGGVKPDGTTITVDNTGIISAQTDGAIHKTLPKDSLGDYLKNPVNKAWVIDWVNNPDKYIIDIRGCKVIRTVKVGSTFYYYYFSNSDDTISFYYIKFTDNNFTEISSNQPSGSTSDVYLLTSYNWQNYINLSGGDWENTTDTSDYHFYNAKEVVIFWTDTQNNYHQTYLNVGCDRWGNYGSTWGNSWANTQIYLDKWSEYNGASITYDGSNVNASNCSINSICYKT